MSDLAREASELAEAATPDLDYFERATRALALELPSAVYDDYAPMARALLERLGELTAERDAATTEVGRLHDRAVTAGVRMSALESALRQLVAACELWASDDLDGPHVPRRVAKALEPARALLAHEPEGTE